MDNLKDLDDDYGFCTEAINFHNRHLTTLDAGDYSAELGKDFAESHWYEIDKFVKNIEAAQASTIKSILDKLNKGELPSNAIVNRYQDKIYLMRTYDPERTYSPHVQLFYDVANRILNDYPTTAQEFRALVKNIREETQTKHFKKKANRKKEKLKGNEKASLDYINLIFESHARLAILRVDLHLKISNVDRMDQHAKIREKFAQFLNDRRSNKFFNHELGYIWKFEDGHTLGGHYHLIFILNGAYIQKDEFIASKIGEYWKKITEGEGTYFNANSKNYLDDLTAQGIGIGVGRIESHDTEKRANLARIVKYFFKLEQYVDVKLSRGARSFGKGTFKKRTAIGGRPRKNTD